MKKFAILCALIVAAAAANNAFAGLIAYYDFEEGSGTVLNDNANGYDGTMTYTSASYWTTGAPAGPTPNGGFYFGNTPASSAGTEYADLGTSVGATNALTIAFWMKAPTTDFYGRVAQKYPAGAGGQGFAIGMRAGGIMRLYVGSETSNSTCTTPAGVIVNDVWTHVAATFVGGTGKLYIDGVLQAQMTGIAQGVNTTGNALRLAAPNPVAANQPWKGMLDEVRIYDTALSEAEIRSIMPEPATLTLLGLGGLFLVRRRK